MSTGSDLDLVIVGGGIGGVICLKYAKDAGLKTFVLERRERVGGLWRDLPSWQDIQFRKEDWTLGDVPLSEERQPGILRNIEAWVERFDLAPQIVLNAPVTSAQFSADRWQVTTEGARYQSRWLIAATGGHNRPVVPQVKRDDSSIAEYHSFELRNPQALRGKRVTVVGGGASAYDLLDLCFTYEASSIAWIYRSTKWMRPTRQVKYLGIDVRLLAKYQMLGLSTHAMNHRINEDLRARYKKAGITEIMPESDFDIRRDQLIPGRPRMIQGFRSIERHRGEVQSVHGKTIRLSNGEEIGTDLLLWGTGYAMDLGYLGLDSLTQASGMNELSARCYSVFRSIDAPNLFLLAPGVLETNTSTPWAYAHVARSIMSHITGSAVFVDPPVQALTNHYDLLKMLAPHDRRNYAFGLWYLKYLRLAMFHPKARPMPIP
ncbi:cation diffusion facilitator CzcD-associated flavoprotein CzcO [Paraburkholderia unamae]|uniref:NAD(P)-binding domain-containing protein n=1 Tax=Paraburkholderia unamae TaxID=219649 RepID=UPI000DC4ADA6|nr:NAD(P)-binding domain-containing protein [Paraburkholderia unamae]RAR67903.1 cation diffusion facilitator CzcD-associated flavoprotein CzcO [Paraburkholderia unamae]